MGPREVYVLYLHKQIKFLTSSRDTNTNQWDKFGFMDGTLGAFIFINFGAIMYTTKANNQRETYNLKREIT